MLGICNGFQVLCEAHLLPGALLANTNLHFTCRQVEVELANPDTAFTRAYSDRRGGSRAAEPPGEARLRPLPGRRGRRLEGCARRGRSCCATRPAESFNGSLDEIAGVCNDGG